METNTKMVRGEYAVEQLRPIPEKLAEFMPLWDSRCAVQEKIARAHERIEAMVILLTSPQAPNARALAPVHSVRPWLESLVDNGASLLTENPEFATAVAELNALRAEEARLTAAMRPLQFRVGDVEVFQNLVTNVGKNDILDKYLKGSAYTQTIRMGLKGTGAPAAGDTQASHATWLEQGGANAPTYTGNRKDVVMGSASGQVSTSPVQAFAITSSGTVFGCFINNGGSATKDDTTGVLFSAGDFSVSRAVVNLDTLNVTYSLTAT